MPDEQDSAASHLSPSDFRRRGHEVVDFIADYWQSLQSPDAPPVMSRVSPGDVLRALPARPPEHGEPWERILADLRSIVMPGLTHWQHPSFFGYFPANASGPGVLAELLSAGLGVNGMLWATSPAATELEMRMLDWFADACGLPASMRFGQAGAAATGGGVIQGTASEAVLVALLAARQRAREQRGSGVSEGVVYASSQAHSSVVKAAMIAGVANGPDDTVHARRIDVDDALAMRPEALDAAMQDDLAAGRRPLMAVATIGTTSSMAVDDAAAVADVCRRHGVWLHVDAAMAGSAAICPEFRPLFRGVEQADSYCFNPHKWLLTSFDCSLFYTRDRAAVTGALAITPEYLRTAASSSGGVIDYRDWQVPLGRRFRALKLWFVVRHYGLQGLRAHVRQGVRHAALFEELISRDERIEVIQPRGLALVCFRPRPAPWESPQQTDARAKSLLERLNATGKVLLTHTVLPGAPGSDGAGPGRYVLRFATGGTFTREEHIRAAAALVRSSV